MNATGLSVMPDTWLAQLLGDTVLAVRLEAVPDAQAAWDLQEALSARLAQARQGGPVFAYAKADVRELDKAHLLERVGFSLADATVGLERHGPGTAVPQGSLPARPSVPADAAAVTSLAGRCFRFSRFHQDARLSSETANRIKAAWAANYFSGQRGDLMVVAEEQGRVIGFLQLLLPQDGGLVIDLIGVDANFQGRGAGRAMIETACRLTGRNRLKVGTQLANTGALAFYQRLGFTIAKAGYVFHYHG